MIAWFHRWRKEQGWWPLLPACSFQVGALATAIIETQVVSVTSEIKMTLGERQVLKVLTTFQYLTKVGPKSPPPGHVAHSMQSIMQPLQQAEISLMPHAVLGYATSIRSRSTSVETDAQLGNYESAMGGMTLDFASSTGTGEPDIEEMEKSPEVETGEDGVNRE